MNGIRGRGPELKPGELRFNAPRFFMKPSIIGQDSGEVRRGGGGNYHKRPIRRRLSVDDDEASLARTSPNPVISFTHIFPLARSARA